jgi:hypothetical protein
VLLEKEVEYHIRLQFQNLGRFTSRFLDPPFRPSSMMNNRFPLNYDRFSQMDGSRFRTESAVEGRMRSEYPAKVSKKNQMEYHISLELHTIRRFSPDRFLISTRIVKRIVCL